MIYSECDFVCLSTDEGASLYPPGTCWSKARAEGRRPVEWMHSGCYLNKHSKGTIATMYLFVYFTIYSLGWRGDGDDGDVLEQSVGEGKK